MRGARRVPAGLGAARAKRKAGLALSTGGETVQAAGGVVYRRSRDDGVEILAIHRPRYDDWTLPKGKLEPGETHEEAAVREVAEETGLHCELGRELPSTSYHDRRGRPKTVRYWAMRPLDGRFRPHGEVDEIRWLAVEAATALLSHGHDHEVLRAFAASVT